MSPRPPSPPPPARSSQPPLASSLFPTHVTIGPDGKAVPVRSTAPPAPRPPLQVTHLTVVPWPDPVIEQRGVDPRSAYVEHFWLGLVGPASVLLVRHLAAQLQRTPAGFELDIVHTARVLGLGTGLGRWGPMQRTIHRCVGFGFARRWGDDRLLVRRRLPPLTQQQVAQLPADRRALHDRWLEAQRRAHLGPSDA